MDQKPVQLKEARPANDQHEDTVHLIVLGLPKPGRDGNKKTANRRFFKGEARGLRLPATGFDLSLERSFPQRGFGVGHIHDKATYRVLIASRRNVY